MPESKAKKRFARLMRTRSCSAEEASKHADELRRLAEETLSGDEAKRKCRFFRALADETRLRMLSLLEKREMCVCEITIALGLTQPTASHHLGILENAGLVRGRKDGKWVFYGLKNRAMGKEIRRLDVAE
jgi:ArsR family transcriptional regulator